MRSLQFVRIDPGLSMSELEELTMSVLEANERWRPPGGDHMVTQIITRGEADMMARRARTISKPTVCIWMESIDFASYAQAWRTGAKVVIVSTTSAPPTQIDSKVKHYSRLSFVLADLEASEMDPSAIPVLRDLSGNVTESIAANIFAVIGGSLITPPANAVLEGISRQTTLEIAEGLGISASEQPLQPYHLYMADEVFLTATQYSILPVGSVDGRELGNCPGPVTERLIQGWNELVGMDIRAQIERFAEQSVSPVAV
jgi:branched-subunit amino acid aminotransferase/4-amino-4-deoxychorismate lyase